ncbi:MAG: LuxR family transcriptional regulator [Ilumatobacteraceae bacterium]|nr:LuxR family transcriptional regulator [Ilumatobacteraceae bacterium]
MEQSNSPLSVSLVNDYEIIVTGLAAMLSPYSDRIQVVELKVDGEATRQADIALFDTFAGRRHALSRASAMVRDGVVDHVVLYTWDATADFLTQVENAGVSAVILKSVSGERLVQALERTVSGERMGMSHVTRSPRSEQTNELSNREKEVLALLALGSTNRQIANELYLSVDTVKSHMRRLYSKLGVSNRTQAALRAEQFQLRPALSRMS